ncbi:MAG: hypothetical protein M0Z76_03310 [Gammaproteobacteria bacterium]|nr:hypothetical protein [Gammaproteobacteria bacterium]
MSLIDLAFHQHRAAVPCTGKDVLTGAPARTERPGRLRQGIDGKTAGQFPLAAKAGCFGAAKISHPAQTSAIAPAHCLTAVHRP